VADGDASAARRLRPAAAAHRLRGEPPGGYVATGWNPYFDDVAAAQARASAAAGDKAVDFRAAVRLFMARMARDRKAQTRPARES
jgi:hypothetical protein